MDTTPQSPQTPGRSIKPEFQITMAEMLRRVKAGDLTPGDVVGLCGHPGCGPIKIWVAGPQAKNPGRVFVKCAAEYAVVSSFQVFHWFFFLHSNALKHRTFQFLDENNLENQMKSNTSAVKTSVPHVLLEGLFQLDWVVSLWLHLLFLVRDLDATGAQMELRVSLNTKIQVLGQGLVKYEIQNNDLHLH
jgi:hypothetical protein